jgi:hypothetical protein
MAALAGAPEAGIEFWAQSAAGKMTIDTVSKMIRQKNARQQRNWWVGRSVKTMEPGSPLVTKQK